MNLRAMTSNRMVIIAQSFLAQAPMKLTTDANAINSIPITIQALTAFNLSKRKHKKKLINVSLLVYINKFKTKTRRSQIETML